MGGLLAALPSKLLEVFLYVLNLEIAGSGLAEGTSRDPAITRQEQPSRGKGRKKLNEFFLDIQVDHSAGLQWTMVTRFESIPSRVSK
jgi:hypothetical protein